MYKVIAFSGHGLSGKTTSMEALKEIIKLKYPKLKFQHVSFAAKLKEIAFDLFEWDGDKEIYYPMEGDLETPIPDLGRQLLINIGKYMRKIRPSVWSDYVARKLKDEIESGDSNNVIYIVDDLRFLNEIENLREITKELVLIRVERNESLKLEDVSETQLDEFNEWNYIVDNNGTKKSLAKQLEILFAAILEKK